MSKLTEITIGGIKMKKLGKGKPGRMKSLVTKHLGKSAGEKITKSDGARLMAKGKKTGNNKLVRKGSFIKNMMREEKYEAAITDIDINTRHRNETIKKNGYGPANPDQPGDFWKKKADLWDVSEDIAASMKCNNCAAFDQSPKTLKKIADAIGPDGNKVVEHADIGYCELFEFKCAGLRACDAWVHGGPITEGKGLYHNIHMKRKRGEKMRKAGAKGAPKPSDFDKAKTTVRENTMKSFQEYISEKKLTPAELKKREEVAQAIKRDNPEMPMDKKMAIATSTAKRVTESPKAWDKWKKTPAGKRYAALSPAEKEAKAKLNREALALRALKAKGTVKEAIEIPDKDEKKLTKIVKGLKKSVKGHDKQQKYLQKLLDKDAKNEEACCDDCKYDHQITEAEHQGKTVKLNDPIRTSEVPSKKFKVYVKDGDKIKVVRFGDPGLSIKRDDPNRRKSFRARHNCDNPGPKTKARYWSCYQWRSGSKVDS